MNTNEIIAIILFPCLTLIIGSLGGIITAKKIPTWYNRLIRPKFNPPNWLFGPVWTILYLSIGFSGYLIWSKEQSFSEIHKTEWAVYFIQLILNFIWTPLFFGFNLLLISAIEIILLDLFILSNIILFAKINIVAGLILIPYFIWVSFASYLNWSFWYLNREKVHTS